MNLNKYIDSTILKADANQKQIVKLCSDAKRHDFASVCVNPHYVKLCAQLLKGTNVKVCTVIGFPLGSNTTAIKVLETKDAIKNGASEIDMVINISWLKENKLSDCIKEIKAIKQACGKKILKVIVETALLNNKQKINACKCVLLSKADFIKTSTGFSTSGATLEDIKLFKKIVKNKAFIKASGGIKTIEQMLDLIKCGANRIGTSCGVELMAK